MESKSVRTSNLHHGHNVRRLRNILGIKQNVIAEAVNMSQQNFSKLEQKEIIDSDMLEKIAAILEVPADVIKNFNEDGVINIISSTFNNSSSVMYHPNIVNPLDKIVELYEKLLAAKNEEIGMLKKELGVR